MNVKNPGPLRAQVEKVLGVLFPKLALQCASVNCEEVKGGKLPFDDEGFCEECSMGMKWHNLRRLEEKMFKKTSKSTGTLSVDHQEAILLAREEPRYWRGVSRTKAVEESEGRQLSAGLDYDQHLALMEARYDH